MIDRTTKVLLALIALALFLTAVGPLRLIRLELEELNNYTQRLTRLAIQESQQNTR